MLNQQNLRSTLLKLDNLSYKAYGDIKGNYDFGDFTLMVEHVQADPFAAPSKLIVKVPQSVAGFPPSLYNSKSREIALRDYLTRQFDRGAKKFSSDRGTGKSGLITIARFGQEVLKRTSVFIDDNSVEVRFFCGTSCRWSKNFRSSSSYDAL